ncbi:MAG: RNA pseudouridine synthase, partial [Alphaproteobacteria bacterium]|nr:RNA pseudouridine synthase [Alphaproteobacteria bacterium]
GHAIVGDPVYGGGRSRAKGLPDIVQQAVAGLGRQALHAASLGFVHPLNGQFHSYDSPLPDDMAVLLGTLEQI